MTLLSYTHNFANLLKQPEDWNKAQTSFNEVRNIINGQLSDDNFLAASGMYTAYRTIYLCAGLARNDIVAGTYLFQGSGNSTLTINGATGTSNVDAKYLDDADFAISGRTTRLRVRGIVDVNGTAPAINFTFGIAPLTVSGVADQITYSAGAAVAGSNIAINTPSSGVSTPGTGSDFALPADGVYLPFVATSGTLANNSVVCCRFELQQHWI